MKVLESNEFEKYRWPHQSNGNVLGHLISQDVAVGKRKGQGWNWGGGGGGRGGGRESDGGGGPWQG